MTLELGAGQLSARASRGLSVVEELLGKMGSQPGCR